MLSLSGSVELLFLLCFIAALDLCCSECYVAVLVFSYLCVCLFCVCLCLTMLVNCLLNAFAIYVGEVNVFGLKVIVFFFLFFLLICVLSSKE